MDSATKTTLTVKDSDGKTHLIHSTEFGIAAIVDCLKRLSQLESDTCRCSLRCCEAYKEHCDRE